MITLTNPGGGGGIEVGEPTRNNRDLAQVTCVTHGSEGRGPGSPEARGTERNH